MPSLAPAVLSFAIVIIASLPVSFLLPGGAPLGDWMAGVLIALLSVVAPWWVGRSRLLMAEQRESDAAILAERAQDEERARIADDLHDTIGHELALIAVQAGALELGADLDVRQRERFRELREAAVRASGRLRDVVQMTRPGGSSRLDPVSGGSVDDLVTGAREAGMTVHARVDRALLSEVHPLIAELTVRTIREGLTNAARHAPGAAVEVEVARADSGGIVVSVRSAVSTGRGAATATSASSGGHGLPSLRRRAEALGGALDAGPTGTGGFELSLHAPAEPQPARTTGARTVDPALRANAQSARRRLVQAAFVPAVIVVLILAGYVVVQAVTVAQTAISSDTYDRIELGMTRSELASMLPAGIPAPVPVVVEPPRPDGAECEYFAARDGWLHFTDATYRLCFTQGVLIAKTLLEAS